MSDRPPAMLAGPIQPSTASRVTLIVGALLALGLAGGAVAIVATSIGVGQAVPSDAGVLEGGALDAATDEPDAAAPRPLDAWIEPPIALDATPLVELGAGVDGGPIEPPPIDAGPTGEVVAPFDERNPWGGPTPRLLAGVKRTLDRGGRLTGRAERALYEYAGDRRNDPRPHLLLARGFVRRGYLSDAIERYLQAYEKDTAAANDPMMLRDLVTMSAHPSVSGRAARSVRQIYGARAIPEVERQLGRGSLDEQERARLERLRGSL